jgi:hypothetical protein
MKKNVILTLIFSLFLAVTAVFAQGKTSDFSGNWELDTNKSKLGERARVESMTMSVSQTGNELKIETKTKHAISSEGEVRVGEKNGAGMIRRDIGSNFGETTQIAAYNLGGTETKSEIPGIPIATTVFKAKLENGGKLYLTSNRASEKPKGAITVKETWTLSADGKTLTVVREHVTPQGNVSAEMVFNKK